VGTKKSLNKFYLVVLEGRVDPQGQGYHLCLDCLHHLVALADLLDLVGRVVPVGLEDISGMGAWVEGQAKALRHDREGRGYPDGQGLCKWLN
jgi:hypothetical protein